MRACHAPYVPSTGGMGSDSTSVALAVTGWMRTRCRPKYLARLVLAGRKSEKTSSPVAGPRGSRSQLTPSRPSRGSG